MVYHRPSTVGAGCAEWPFCTVSIACGPDGPVSRTADEQHPGASHPPRCAGSNVVTATVPSSRAGTVAGHARPGSEQAASTVCPVTGAHIDNETPRAIVYIDGLNLYGSALKHSAHKWVDLMAAAEQLIPAWYTLAGVKYFSADLHPDAAEDPASPMRQRHYMKALAATGVEIHRGTFVVSTRWRTIATGEAWAGRTRPALPAALASPLDAIEATLDRPMKISVRLPEEKFTDVAIGVELVDDFHHARCDLSVLVTNDADLKPAIAKIVTQGHLVHIVSPAATVNKHLARAATTSTPMPSSLLEDHQLPDEFTIASGEKFSKPNAWKTGK